MRFNVNYNNLADHVTTVQEGQTAYLEEYQPLTKLPINLWIDNASRAYLSPLIYILGQGEIALKWNGEMIGVRHIRLVLCVAFEDISAVNFWKVSFTYIYS